MNSNFKKCLDSLNDNEVAIRSDALRILSSLCDNIISFPNNDEYRRIRVDDPRIGEKLLKTFGAIECLFEMGFVEDGEYFLLPPEAPLFKLRQIQKALHDLQTEERSTTASEKIDRRDGRAKVDRGEIFLAGIVEKFKRALIYEDSQLRSKAKCVVPLEALQLKAMEKMRRLQKKIKNGELNERAAITSAEYQITMEDLLLAELLDWFKNDFFAWVDSPSCNVCGKACVYDRIERSTDLRISRTEIHKCEDCGVEAKFPRYTDPGILLKTRSGRCGEWANTFTLICRSLNFDTRIVHDETDHVWTEVWSMASHKWIHADPCENVMGRPLLYERGWKKKLTYVIAYSRDEIQDVTWRYTRDQAAVMKRRKLCSESDLCSLICKLNNERENSPGYSEARRQFVTKRRALELVEMLPAPPGTKKPGDEDDESYEGRTSGSLTWRMLRGETVETLHKPQTWIIPRDAKLFQIQYYSAKDEYEFLVSGEKKVFEKKSGWQNGVVGIEGGIFRKVENDWKMAYLVRAPGQTRGCLIWRFEIVECDRCIKSFELRAKCASFHSGRIRWRIEGSNGDMEKPSVSMSIDNWENFHTKSLKGLTRINLIAELLGGDGNEAWQHAQLFRQNLMDRNECSMTITLEIGE